MIEPREQEASEKRGKKGRDQLEPEIFARVLIFTPILPKLSVVTRLVSPISDFP
jgi:hypothetical protein